MIPTILNDKQLGLPVTGRDHNVSVADRVRDYDYVNIPKMTVAKLEVKGNIITIKETDLIEENVEAWLGDTIIVGMNFLRHFDIAIKRDGRIIIER